MNKLVAAALPEYSELIGKNGSRVYYLLMDRLEEKLVGQLQGVLLGVEADKASVEHAGIILERATEVLKKGKTIAVPEAVRPAPAKI